MEAYTITERGPKVRRSDNIIIFAIATTALQLLLSL